MQIEYLALEKSLRIGGGPDKIEKIHLQGKLTARERIDMLLDKDSFSQEIGLLVAYDQYDGKAPAAAVVTFVGKIQGRECVVVANDATIKAGAWYPETIKKILRAQEIVMRNDTGHPLVVFSMANRTEFPARGAFGGQPGALREHHIDGKAISPKGRHELAPGGLLTILEAGGGGYGQTSSRSKERIRDDMRRGFLSAEQAKRVYGLLS